MTTAIPVAVVFKDFVEVIRTYVHCKKDQKIARVMNSVRAAVFIGDVAGVKAVFGIGTVIAIVVKTSSANRTTNVAFIPA